VRRPLDRRAFLAGLGATAFIAVACAGDDDGDGNAADATTSTTTPAAGSPPPVPGPAAFVASGPTTTNEVALTFHTDGDLAIAEELLAIFADYDVLITAFIVGKWLEANPDWAAMLIDGGHELANHTYSHPSNFTALDATAMSAEIVGCRDVLTRLVGAGGSLFRPSGTADGTATPPQLVLDVASQDTYPTVLGFDVDPYDYQDPGSNAVIERTLAAVGPGSIVSLHFGHPGTVDAMPAILDGLDERGLGPVTASELLAS
jgi:peptidoglycan/xylan/chitin deacetylase (PgdA/CDA1 family)